MISFEDAMHILRTVPVEATTELVPLNLALGRVLARTALADTDQPSFSKSAMDGYACQMADLGKELEQIETIAAGIAKPRAITSGQCSKIMTGAPLPEGADAVFMVEESEVLASGKVRYTGSYRPNVCDTEARFSPNIRHRGEDCKQGDALIQAGTQLRAAHIAILAGLGQAQVAVYALPRVAVISTGSELVEPHEVPTKGQIRNTNGPQLVAQLAQMGITAQYLGIAPDTPADTAKLFESALRNTNLILFSGGVSMGDYDYVPQILKEAGFQLHFQKVAVQPGKPTLFAQRGSQYCFGLPGNPVSSFVQFELMVRPFITKLCGTLHEAEMWHMPLGADFRRGKAKRMSWIPIRLIGGQVHPTNYNGSGHITALAQADGFIAFPVGVSHLKKGDWIDVRQL